ncbi:GGDEF domain-containing protein [Oryzifoliimicrobium ureilyticus]|uniref:GGDEF domain-containing protein n=1 Tax=Oryzifoliimicrobium ureilyticus TaxID=3113724 RepID=UPI00307627D1
MTFFRMQKQADRAAGAHPTGPARATTTIGRFSEFLIAQDNEVEEEVLRLSLRTLYDDDLMSITILGWTQLGWIWTLMASGWMWIVACMVADLVLFGVRWRLRHKFAGDGPVSGQNFEVYTVWINMALMFLVGLDCAALLLSPSQAANIYGLVVACGFNGYICALHAAFRRFGTVNIFIVDAFATFGLIFNDVDAMRCFAWLGGAGAFGFYLLLRKSHANLIGAIRAQHANRQLSLHDPLTKLPNRLLLRESLAKLTDSIGAPQGPSCVSILWIDLDGFKQINDRHGHAAGDEVLLRVADLLRQTIGPNDIAARIGGDEFVVVLPDASTQRAGAVAHMLIKAVSAPFLIRQLIPVVMGASIGVARATDKNHDIEQLFHAADAALYEVKRTGKGRVSFADALLTPAEDAALRSAG